MGVIINKGFLKLRYMESLSKTESNLSLLCSQKAAVLEELTLSDYKGFNPVKEYLTQRNRSITNLLRELEMAESMPATLGYICLCIAIQLQRVQIWTHRQRNKNKQIGDGHEGERGKVCCSLLQQLSVPTLFSD